MVSSQPLVSVIIPAYNHQDYILDCVNSVFNQTYQNFELIIINDGSTDDTGKMLDGLSDERIKLFHQENSGTVAALNKGIEVSQGKYLSFLNSDDIYHRERIALLVAELEGDENVSFAATKVTLIDNRGEIVSSGSEFDWLEKAYNFYQATDDLFLSILKDNFICTSSNFFFRRQLLDEVGTLTNLRYVHDLDYLLRIFLVCNVKFCQRELLEYRVHSENTIKEKSDDFNEKLISEISYVLAVFLANCKGRDDLFGEELAKVFSERFADNLDSILLFLIMIWAEEEIEVSFFTNNAPVQIKTYLSEKIQHLNFITDVKNHNKQLAENIQKLIEDVASLNSTIGEQGVFIGTLQNNIQEKSDEVNRLWQDNVRKTDLLNTKGHRFMSHLQELAGGTEVKKNLEQMLRIIFSKILGR